MFFGFPKSLASLLGLVHVHWIVGGYKIRFCWGRSPWPKWREPRFPKRNMWNKNLMFCAFPERAWLRVMKDAWDWVKLSNTTLHDLLSSNDSVHVFLWQFSATWCLWMRRMPEKHFWNISGQELKSTVFQMPGGRDPCRSTRKGYKSLVQGSISHHSRCILRDSNQFQKE